MLNHVTIKTLMVDQITQFENDVITETDLFDSVKSMENNKTPNTPNNDG